MNPEGRAIRVVKNRSAGHIHVHACLVVCIDPRFWNSGDGSTSIIGKFLREKAWNCVPLSKAGGIKCLVQGDPADRANKEVLLADIRQELKLHSPHIIAISVHRDCGAYGYFKAFDNDHDRETERLYGDLYKAKELLIKEFGMQARIETYLFDADGVEEIIF